MILSDNIIKATFIERSNRYRGIVRYNDNEVDVYIPNPGRMSELLVHGYDVLISKVDQRERKTAYDLIGVKYNGYWVSIDSRIPNKLLHDLLNQKVFEEFLPYKKIESEKSFMNSRFDFFLSGKGKGCYIEAKSCTLVENGVALFPDAPTKRGVKHLGDLITAVKKGFEAYIIIIIQREDANLFKPNKKTDSDFANMLQQAVNQGVKIIAFTNTLSETEINYHKRIEVSL